VVGSKSSRRKGNPFYLSKEWKAVRLKVLSRDKWKCQMCGVRCLGVAKGMPSPEVDHIQPLKDFPQLKLEMSNLRTLCKSCHSRHTMLGQIGEKKIEIGLDGFPVESA
jgi:5-methylcytosine-specific restriction protein A